MAVTINGTNGVSAVQTGAVESGDLASSLDLSSKSIILPPINLDQIPETVSANIGEASQGSNAYSVLDTFPSLSAGYWKFTIYASVVSSVNAKIALFYKNQTFGANTGYTNDTKGLFAEAIIEADGIADATFEYGRNDDGGSTTIRGARAFGVKIG